MYGYHLATESLVDKNGNGFPKLTGNGPSNFQIKKSMVGSWLATLFNRLYKKRWINRIQTIQ